MSREPASEKESDAFVTEVELTPLILVKAYYFASFAFYATYFRYLTLYFESDGLSASEIGILWSVYRVVGTVTTPFWAGLADRTKRARDMVQISLACSWVPFMLLLLPCTSANRFALRAAALWGFGFCSGPQSALRDALAIAACGNDPDRWGKARVYGAIGWGIMHLLLGPLVDRFGFIVLFSSHIVLALFLFFVTRVGVPESCGKVKKEVTVQEVSNIFLQNRLFFLNMIAIGAGFSMVEGMLFLLLQQMHASTLLCGLSVVVTVLFELPIFHYANKFLEKLGTRYMVLVGQAAWVVRAFFYASMSEAWTVLLIEPLHGVTFALVWTASTQHVASPLVSGEGLEASAQGLLNVCFMGIGPFIGLTVGGVLFDTIGSHLVYAVFACGIMLVGFVYAYWGATEADKPRVRLSNELATRTFGRVNTSLSEGDGIIEANGEEDGIELYPAPEFRGVDSLQDTSLQDDVRA